MTLDVKTIAISELVPGQGNPKLHDLVSIKDSLTRYGQYKPIVVNLGTETGTVMEVLAGNGTVQAAEALGWTEIDITLIDVDAVTAKKIMAMDNRSHDLGGYDEDALGELLKEIVTIDDLGGTGYTDKDLLKLLKQPEAPSSDAVMAGLEYRVIVDCSDESDQLKLMEALESEGRTVRPLIS